MEPEEIITLTEACKIYKTDRRKIVQLIKSGVIVAYQPTQRYLISVSSIQKWWLSVKVTPLGRPRKD